MPRVGRTAVDPVTDAGGVFARDCGPGGARRAGGAMIVYAGALREREREKAGSADQTEERSR